MAIGTPDEVAEVMVNVFDQCAADGFNVVPATVPGGLKDFVGLVVPELRQEVKLIPDTPDQRQQRTWV